MKRAPLRPLALALFLVVASCGRVAGRNGGSVEASDMTRVASKVPLGQATVLFAVLPAADGTWTALVGGAGTEESDPSCGTAGWEISVLRTGAAPSPVVALEGRLLAGIPLGSLGRDVVVPPRPRVGDPIAVSAWTCDPSKGRDGTSRSLLLGTIGVDGLPADLRPIAGLGAPAGAPGGHPESGSAAISADRETLAMLVDACPDPYNGTSAECDVTRWSYDLATSTWTKSHDPSFPRSGWAGQIWTLADGSLIEVVDDGMSPATLYEGTEIFDDTAQVDVAPDGQSALLSVLQHSTGYAKVVLLEAGGEPRTLYEREVASADDRFWGAPFSATFSGDGGSVYFDQPGASSWHVLWKLDIATGDLTELVELPEVVRYTMLPDESGLIVELEDPSRSDFNAWELWSFASAG